MKNIWTAVLAPEDLLRTFLRINVIPANVVLLETENWVPPPTGKCLLAWDHDPSDGFGPPSVIAADQAVLAAMLPKLMAMPGSLSPVTNFCRFWESAQATTFFSNDTDARPLGGLALTGLVGLCIGETFCRNHGTLELRRLGQATVNRTFAHACSKLIVRGVRPGQLDLLRAAWIDAATLTHNTVDRRLLSVIAYLAEFLCSHSKAPESGAAELASQIDGWLLTNAVWYRPSGLGAEVRRFVSTFKAMPRELRFALAEQTLERVRKHATVETENDSALLGGLVLALIDPGSLNFFDLAFAADEFGGVACAYSLCTALLGGPQFLWKGDGLGISLVSGGLRVQSRLLESSPDISLRELGILRDRITDAGFDFRTKTPTVVEVELLPDICGSFPNGARRDAVAAKGAGEHQPSLFAGSDIAQRLEKAADLAIQLADSLVELRGDNPQIPAKKRKASKSRYG